MTFNDIRKIIETRFKNNWSTTPVEWPNMPFDHQAQVLAGKKSPWVRLTIIDGDAENVALGGMHQRYSGIVIIGIFVPEKTGTGTARGYADVIAAIFQNVSDQGVRFKVPRYEDIGPTQNKSGGNSGGGWFQGNLTVGFVYDKIS